MKRLSLWAKSLWCLAVGHRMATLGYIGTSVMLFRREQCRRCEHKQAVAASLFEVMVIGPVLIDQILPLSGVPIERGTLERIKKELPS